MMGFLTVNLGKRDGDKFNVNGSRNNMDSTSEVKDSVDVDTGAFAGAFEA